MSAPSEVLRDDPCVILLGRPIPEAERAVALLGRRLWRAECASAVLEGGAPRSARAVLVDWREEALRGAPRALRTDPDFNGAPVVLLVASGADACAIDRADAPADDFADLSRGAEELAARLALAESRAARAASVNALTLLPGLGALRARAERLMAEVRAFGYGATDFSSFSAFNARYGFREGDEALRCYADMFRSVVARFGGAEAMAARESADDFYFLCDADRARDIGEEPVACFDQAAPSFYSEEDREARHIALRTRAGQELLVPLMTLSVACVADRGGDFRHFAELAQATQEIAAHLKAETRSRCLVDRRFAPRLSDAPESARPRAA